MDILLAPTTAEPLLRELEQELRMCSIENANGNVHDLAGQLGILVMRNHPVRVTRKIKRIAKGNFTMAKSKQLYSKNCDEQR